MNANVSLIENLYAAFGRGDIAAIVAAMAPDVVWKVNGTPGDHPAIGTFEGPARVQEFFKIVGDTQQAVSFTPREFYDAGDTVVVLGHYAWTIRKTGKPIDTDWVHIFTIKDGKVTGFREFNDTAQFAKAMRG